MSSPRPNDGDHNGTRPATPPQPGGTGVTTGEWVALQVKSLCDVMEASQALALAAQHLDGIVRAGRRTGPGRSRRTRRATLVCLVQQVQAKILELAGAALGPHAARD